MTADDDGEERGFACPEVLRRGTHFVFRANANEFSPSVRKFVMGGLRAELHSAPRSTVSALRFAAGRQPELRLSWTVSRGR